MIVRCINILSPTGDELRSHPAIKVGEEYSVLTVSASPGRDVLFRVYARNPDLRDTHPGPPALWRAQMFEPLSDLIPSNWRIAVSSTGSIRIGPESWLLPGFWSDLDEWSAMSERSRLGFQTEIEVILAAG